MVDGFPFCQLEEVFDSRMKLLCCSVDLTKMLSTINLDQEQSTFSFHSATMVPNPGYGTSALNRLLIPDIDDGDEQPTFLRFRPTTLNQMSQTHPTLHSIEGGFAMGASESGPTMLQPPSFHSSEAQPTLTGSYHRPSPIRSTPRHTPIVLGRHYDIGGGECDDMLRAYMEQYKLLGYEIPKTAGKRKRND